MAPSPREDDGGDEDAPLAEINVTPLVDVMLVLLVIFMVTAPMLTAGVGVDLPRTSAAPLRPPRPPLELTLARDGRLFLQREQVAEAALEARLAALRVEDPERALHLRGDRGLDYGAVLRVMGLAQRAGVTRVALVSEPGGTPATAPGPRNAPGSAPSAAPADGSGSTFPAPVAAP